MKVKIKRLPHYPTDWELPQYGSEHAACFDLRAIFVKGDLYNDVDLFPNEVVIFDSGLSFEVPVGFVMMVYPRSGLGFKYGVTLINGTGVIDSDYRGQVKIGLSNHGNEIVNIKHGDRIAQAMIIPVPRIEWEEVEELSETGRGENGFGSTGR